MSSTAPQSNPLVDALLGLVAQAVQQNPQVLGQFATTLGVAQAVAAPAPEVKVETPRDRAYAHAKDKGYGFTKGGEVVVSADTLQAAARVLRTGTPEIVAAPDTDSLRKRGITHIVAYKVDDTTVAFHQLFSLVKGEQPTAA